MRRGTKEVLAELVGKLKEKLDPKKLAATSAGEHQRGELRPNLDRLTVGVDLGDQSLRSIGETVRHEKALDFSGCNSRPGTGSLHPVAIEKSNDLSAYIFKSDFIPG